MPPRKASHGTRNVTLAVVAVFVLLAAIGSANRPTTFVAATVPPGASDAGPVDPDATDEPTPTAGEAALISFEGSGPLTSDPFGASGNIVDVSYDYTCATEDTFTVNFYGTYDSPLLPDVLVSEFGASGSGTASEALNGTTGPFTVEVDSPCDWSVEVTGTP